MSTIRDAGLMSQVTDYAGMQYGQCRPTDIDLSMDFNKEVFIFVELKFEGTSLTLGQRIHLIGLVDAIEAGGREAYAILATHKTDRRDRIMARDAFPVMVYSGGNWEMCEDSNLDATIKTIHDNWKKKRRDAKVVTTSPHIG